MTRPAVRDDFSRGEAIAGLVWLSVGALVSLVLEVVYLNWIWVVVALLFLSLIHISEPTRPVCSSRMPSSA